MCKWSVVLACAAALVFGGAIDPVKANPLIPADGALQAAIDAASLVTRVQCRRIWRTVPYCTYTRYRGRVCGRRGYWQTVCTRRSRLQRYCYRTAYRGTLCEWRRVYY